MKNLDMERIDIDTEMMCGKPVFRGTRLTVEHVIGLLARGETIDSILAEYDGLSREDILACAAFHRAV
jgi:uncharacterized protein (DUF433 family)